MADPAVSPFTIPVLPIVATNVLLLLQVPPGVTSVSGIVEPTQTVVGPLMLPPLTLRLTVTIVVATSPDES